MDYSQSQSEGTSNTGGPSPTDFAAYLPWACNEMELEETVVVVKVIQSKLITRTSEINFGSGDQKKGRSQRAKQSQSLTKTDADYGLDKDDSSMSPMILSSSRCVKIWATYDKATNLVQIDFDKHSTVPRKVLQIICLLLPLQTYLQTVNFKGRIDKYTIPELTKVLSATNITDVCLDNVFLAVANFHLLLDVVCSLRNLSLSRCKINDEALKVLAEKLTYPVPASKTLAFLNVSLNMITDVGAKYLGEALRSNRQLYYLNLAGNMLTDVGASSILESLQEFPLTYEETTGKRSRHMDYIKLKEAMIQQKIKDLAEEETRVKSRAQSVVSDKKIKIPKPDNAVKMSDSERAIALVEKALGTFKDPFHVDNTFANNDYLYSNGNNALCYLNLAYNNLGFFTVEMLLAVLKSQRILDKKPRGLLKVLLEGNPIPLECKEIKELDDLFEAALYTTSKKLPSQTGKRKSVKNL